MHRSGTSLVAGALSRSGVDFGDNLLEPRDDNPKGFYEHVDLLAMNEGVLGALHSSYDDIEPLPDRWWQRPEVLPYKERICEVIRRDFSRSSLFGFKDPRICVLMPLYLDALASMGVKPRVIIVSREIGEIAESLRVRNDFSYSKSFALTKKHTDELEKHIRGLDVCRLTMKDFISDPAAALEHIRNDLWIPLLPYEQVKSSLDSFIDPSLKHHSLGTETFVKKVIEDHARVYEEKENVKKELSDEIAHNKEARAELVREFESHKETMQAHLNAAAVEHESLTHAIYERDAKITERDAKIAALAQNLAEASQTLAHSAEGKEVLNHTIAHRDSRIASLEEEVARAHVLAIEADRLRHAIEAMERSVTWKSIRRFQRLIDAILPEGSALRRLYNRGIIRMQAAADRKKQRSAGESAGELAFPSIGPIDILFVTHEESRTGAPRILFQIARHMARSKSIAIASKGGGGMHEEFSAAFKDRLIYPIEYCLDKERFNVARETLLALKPRLVYVNSIVSHEYAYEAKKLGIPVAFHVHEIGEAFDRAIEKDLHDTFKDSADVFLAVSQATYDFLVQNLACDPAKIELVHEFIDGDAVRRAAKEKKRKEVEEELGITDETKMVIAVGTFDRRKGADLFVKTAKKLATDVPDARFVWVGRGAMPHEGMLETMREYRDHFYHVGETRNPFPYLARADALFLSSREDPFPLVVLEAMALGVPVVAFERSGGAKEAIAPGAGVIVKEMSVARASEAVTALLGDRKGMKRMGEIGVESQKAYEARPALDRLQTLLDKHIKAETAVVSSGDALERSVA